MNTEYTPTTEEVRRSYKSLIVSGQPEESKMAEFDRWLSELIRKNREEAWDEAERSIHSWYKTYPETLYCAPENPYQKE